MSDKVPLSAGVPDTTFFTISRRIRTYKVRLKRVRVIAARPVHFICTVLYSTYLLWKQIISQPIHPVFTHWLVHTLPTYTKQEQCSDTKKKTVRSFVTYSVPIMKLSRQKRTAEFDAQILGFRTNDNVFIFTSVSRICAILFRSIVSVGLLALPHSS
jgi:hypothetical protein